MLVKKQGKEFLSTIDIVCPRCGAILEVDARDVKIGTGSRAYFTFKCDWCKRKSVEKTDILPDELIEEYNHLSERG